MQDWYLELPRCGRIDHRISGVIHIFDCGNHIAKHYGIQFANPRNSGFFDNRADICVDVWTRNAFEMRQKVIHPLIKCKFLLQKLCYLFKRQLISTKNNFLNKMYHQYLQLIFIIKFLSLKFISTDTLYWGINWLNYLIFYNKNKICGIVSINYDFMKSIPPC